MYMGCDTLPGMMNSEVSPLAACRFGWDAKGKSRRDLPDREQVMEQIMGAPIADWDFQMLCRQSDAIETLQDTAAQGGPNRFLVCAFDPKTREGDDSHALQLVGAWSMFIRRPSQWMAKLRTMWAELRDLMDAAEAEEDIAKRNDLMPLYRSLTDDKAANLDFYIQWACTAGGLDKDDPQYRKGISKAMLRAMPSLIYDMWVKPAARYLFLEHWIDPKVAHATDLIEYPTQEDAEEAIMHACMLTLSALDDNAERAWTALGFQPATSSAFFSDLEDDDMMPMFKLAFPRHGEARRPITPTTAMRPDSPYIVTPVPTRMKSGSTRDRHGDGHHPTPFRLDE
jgi:hypothetical protein